MGSSRLSQSFFDRPTRTVARGLLGKRLVRRYRGQRLSGLIVETEAYLGPDDPASHSRFGPGSRAAPMFGPPAHAYVYFTYGMHYCLNCVTEPEGSGTAVLIRAIDPEEGIATMRRLRGGVTDSELTNGPGKLCQAMAIDVRLNAKPLTSQGSRLWLENTPGKRPAKIGQTARVGVRSGRERRLRFHLRDNPHVSPHPRY